MKTTKITALISAALLAAAVLLAGCGSAGEEEETAYITISLGESRTAVSWNPSVTVENILHDIFIDDSSVETGVKIGDGVKTYPVNPGSHKVSVYGYYPARTLVSYGKATANLSAGQKAPCPVTMGNPTQIGGPTWTAVADSTFGTSAIRAIAYGNGKFVAVGQGGKMAYSSDGVIWTAIPPGTDNGTTTTLGAGIITAIAYGGGKFVAGSQTGKIAYSSDGVSWTMGSTWTSFTINRIAWGNDRFVAVAGSTNGNNVAYSQDGVNWTKSSNSVWGIDRVQNICWGNNKFFAHNSSKYGYSDDGVSWTTFSPDYNIFRLNWARDRFFYYKDTSGIYEMVYSYDGVSWTSDGINWTGGGTQEYEYFTWGNGKYVATSDGGRIAWSVDGLNWTTIPPGTVNGTTTTFSTSSDIYAIAYGGGKFVVGSMDGKMAYSQD